MGMLTIDWSLFVKMCRSSSSKNTAKYESGSEYMIGGEVVKVGLHAYMSKPVSDMLLSTIFGHDMS